MGTELKNGNGKKKSKRVWSKQDSAEFAEHLEERGLSIVPKDTIEKQNAFIRSITEGLNFSDPANAGRKMAVVWQDHMEFLNTVAKTVLKLGMAQAAHDEAIDAADASKVATTNEDVIKARGVIEALADHLADKEKSALAAVHFYDETGKKVSSPSEIKPD